MKRILLIAATDSSSGAGLFQDIKVADRLKFWSFPIITGITLQTFKSLEFIRKIDDKLLKKQLDFALNNFTFDAVKIGAICGNRQIEIIKEFLVKTECKNVVIDPVISPTSGKKFINNPLLYEKLFRPNIAITPNIPELKKILQLPEITGITDLVESALSYSKKKDIIIYLTGGHSEDKYKLTEYLISPNGIKSFQKEKKNWSYLHGTGCALSTAFAINKTSFNIFDAVKRSSEYVTELFGNFQNI